MKSDEEINAGSPKDPPEWPRLASIATASAAGAFVGSLIGACVALYFCCQSCNKPVEPVKQYTPPATNSKSS